MNLSKYILPYIGLCVTFFMGLFPLIRWLLPYVLTISTAIFILFLITDFYKKRLKYKPPSILHFLNEGLFIIIIVWTSYFLLNLYENIIVYIFLCCHIIIKLYKDVTYVSLKKNI
ncbi:hypothetical protein A7A78_01400 [Aequorivita soesokkakensis]|uniref:Uncharacterized protein n=1 Tax=Aequorivita soesokkakensis TaxID=1385699 RepID=A0A1A9LIN5_9FLAO|nr:hypothetical protein A7A78_01400 [Aequorivita soesokkakensis]